MIDRASDGRAVAHLIDLFPVTAILGARQVGKTTLARQLAATWREHHHFDLENPRHAAQLRDPLLALEPLEGLVVLDEVQRAPDVFEVLRVLADRPDRSTKFLVLGSASPDLVRGVSETLAGRIGFHDLGGFGLDDVGLDAWPDLWTRGGFPRSFLADSAEASALWRQSFVRTFLERDLPAAGIGIPPSRIRDFWSMLAHYHGQLWNGEELARAFAVSGKTVRRYLDVLAGTYMVRVLPPWHINVGKRVVKRPKVYIRDSGLLHTLLDLPTAQQVSRHPKVGASWEGFALDQVIRRLGARSERCWFYATHDGAELDLLVDSGGRRLGFEFKRTSAPRRTRSMTLVSRALDLERLDVLYPGEDVWPMGENIRAVGIGAIESIEPLAFSSGRARSI